MIYDWIIIGAGASGLFAGAAAPSGSKILILNKGKKPGLKLLMTGSGQCNLTHSGSIKDFINCYGGQGKKIRSILYSFSNVAVADFFEQNGVPLIVRSDGKMFPKSMKADDILGILLRKCRESGVEIRNDCAVTDILPDKTGVSNRVFKVKCGDSVFESRKVLVAGGGRSYPATGSDGSLHAILSGLGIEIVETKPALTPVSVQDYPYTELTGYAVENAEIRISGATLPPIKATGALLFTHKNFSGPVMLDSSRYVSPGLTLTINYFPGKSLDVIVRELSAIRSGKDSGRDTSALQNEEFAGSVFPRRGLQEILTVLSNYFRPLSKGFLRVICNRAGIDPAAPFSRATKREIAALAKIITADAFSISGTDGYKNAMATAGGVSLDEISLKTLESTKIPGLYFSGEILDVDGDTGGYNLQFAFSSGHLAINS